MLQIEETPLEVLIYAQQISFPISYLGNERILGPREGAPAPGPGSEICVKQLPLKLFENKFVPLFSRVGKIYKTRLLLSRDKKDNRGIAYITFETEDAARRALSLNNTEIIPGYYIRVDLSNDNRRLFVGGVPEDKSRQDIWHEMLRAGFKLIIDVIMYRSFSDPRKNRGFVFVEFPTHQEATKALEKFKTVRLFGNRVHCDWSTPLNKNPPQRNDEVRTIFINNLRISDKRGIESILLNVLQDDCKTIEKMQIVENNIVIQFYTRRDGKKAMCLLKEFFKFAPSIVVEWWIQTPNDENNKENTIRKPNNFSNSINRNMFAPRAYETATSTSASFYDPPTSASTSESFYDPRICPPTNASFYDPRSCPATSASFYNPPVCPSRLFDPSICARPIDENDAEHLLREAENFLNDINRDSNMFATRASDKTATSSTSASFYDSPSDPDPPIDDLHLAILSLAENLNLLEILK